MNNTDKSGYLCLRDKVSYFVKGEDGPGFSYVYSPNIGQRGGCQTTQFPPIEIGRLVLNKSNLIDTIFTLIYDEQAKDKPCVKPKDSFFTDYLRGYSGEPQKHIKYYFRYEYFDE